MVKGIRNPSQIVSVLEREFWSINNKIWESVYSNGVDVMEEDWDNLVILDACRYDYFKKQNNIEGELVKKISKGSNSGEFMERNFIGRSFYDTVYITANPTWERYQEQVFYYDDYLDQEWDNELKTIPPNKVRENAIQAENNFPNKRIISHFMAPHTPYLGDTAIEIKDRTGIMPRDLVKQGEISKQELVNMYTENLDIVLNEIEELVNSLTGKTVITADHGELLLEKPLPFVETKFSHPGIATQKLREVPWLIVDFDERKEISTNKPIATSDTDIETVDKRLKQLGYKV
jgi:hypothetical protein